MLEFKELKTISKFNNNIIINRSKDWYLTHYKFAVKRGNTVFYPSFNVFQTCILHNIIINGQFVPKNDVEILYDAVVKKCKDYFEARARATTFSLPKLYTVGDSDLYKTMSAETSAVRVLNFFYKPQLSTMCSNVELISFLTFNAQKKLTKYRLGTPYYTLIGLTRCDYTYNLTFRDTRTDIAVFYLNQQFVVFKFAEDADKPVIEGKFDIARYAELLFHS